MCTFTYLVSCSLNRKSTPTSCCVRYMTFTTVFSVYMDTCMCIGFIIVSCSCNCQLLSHTNIWCYDVIWTWCCPTGNVCVIYSFCFSAIQNNAVQIHLTFLHRIIFRLSCHMLSSSRVLLFLFQLFRLLYIFIFRHLSCPSRWISAVSCSRNLKGREVLYEWSESKRWLLLCLVLCPEQQDVPGEKYQRRRGEFTWTCSD